MDFGTQKGSFSEELLGVNHFCTSKDRNFYLSYQIFPLRASFGTKWAKHSFSSLQLDFLHDLLSISQKYLINIF